MSWRILTPTLSHTDTTWPNSRQYIEDTFAGVPEDEKYKIVAGNAKKVYNLD
jgi:hypothetical protein